MSETTAIERIKTVAELDELLADSVVLPVVLFKHSTRCHVSFAAHAEVERFVGSLAADRARVGMVLVVEDRALSDTISERFAVRHESPQAFVVRHGAVRWHGSHGGVLHAALTASVAAAAS